MGADAVGHEASPEQVDAMVALLHTSIDAGGLGFSTTLSSTHSDGDGQPVASRHASRDELLALCGAVGQHEGTFLEGAFEGGLDKFSPDEVELVAAMSAAAGRSINWNVLTVDSAVPDRVPRQLAAADRAAELGGRVVALTMPVLVPMNMSFGSFCALWLMPGWSDILRLPPAEKRAALADPEVRRGMEERSHSEEAGVFRRLAGWDRYVIGDTYSSANQGLTGRIVGDIAAERGQDAFATLVEIVTEDDFRTVLWPMPTDNDDESWRMRQAVWDDPRVMLGGSDAGAHLDRMCGSSYTTRLLADCLRGRKLPSLERAVQMLTDSPPSCSAWSTGAAGRRRTTPTWWCSTPTRWGRERPPGRGPARRHRPPDRGVRGRHPGLRRRRGHRARTAGPPAPRPAASCARAATRSRSPRADQRSPAECRTWSPCHPPRSPRKPRPCWTTSWRCGVTCTSTPSWRSTCPALRPACWRRWTGCRCG
jgi:hypothetical protein